MHRFQNLEFHDQPERQTMSFGGMAAAVETNTVNREIKLVFLVEEGSSVWNAKDRARATEIIKAIEQECTGIKLTGDMFRRLLQRSDGIRIGTPNYQSENSVVDCVITIEPRTNYDQIYNLVMSVLKSQSDYEPRGTESVFTTAEEDLIERMPPDAEGEKAAERVALISGDAALSAQHTLEKITRWRRE